MRHPQHILESITCATTGDAYATVLDTRSDCPFSDTVLLRCSIATTHWDRLICMLSESSMEFWCLTLLSGLHRLECAGR